MCRRTSLAAGVGGGRRGDLAGASVDVVSAMAVDKEHRGGICVDLLPLTSRGEPRGLADQLDAVEGNGGIKTGT